LRGGISAITNALAERLGDSLKTNTTVSDISGFDQVYLTTPAFIAAELVRKRDHDLADKLKSIHYSSLSQVYLEVVPGKKKFEGFGFLVPSSERMSLLGAICVSNIFPSKAPEGKMLFVLFCGGDRSYAFAPSDEDAVKEFNKIIQPALANVLHIQEWQNAIPQFYVDHEKILDHLKSFDPKIVFVGNYVTGVAVGDCV
jgi:oxygen-dependent protoporphyrinogen oxidase